MKTFFLASLAIAFAFPMAGNSQTLPTLPSPNPKIAGFPQTQPPLIGQAFSPGRDATTFFETGRLSSEDRLRFQRPPSSLPPMREQSRSWQFVVSKEGRCSFWLPPGIISNEPVKLETAVGDISWRAIVTNTDDRRFAIAYATALTEQQIQSPDLLLDAIRDRIAPADKFKLADKSSITLNSYPGRELRFTGQEESIIVRAYLVNNRAYVLAVIYPNANPQPQMTRGFLNAFELNP